MPHTNEENLREGFAAFSRGDLDTVRSFWHDDIVWHVPGRSSVSGAYEGADAVIGYFGRLFELTGGTLGVELHDVVANDTVSMAMYTARGEREGRRLESRAVLASRLRDEKTTEVWELHHDQYAADEFFA